jgi:hypothetical protein
MRHLIRIVTILATMGIAIAPGLGGGPAPSGAATYSSPPTVNATSWSEVPAPSTASANSNQLNGTSCVTASFCAGVGMSSTTGGTLTEQWNGSSWSIVNSPTVGGNALEAVSCVSASFCMAVGWTSSTTLAEEWNGTSWSTAPTASLPSADFQAQLWSVSCVSTTSCVGVGLAGITTGNVTVAEQWNGTSWTLLQTPNPSAAADSFLYGVDCVSPSFCMAVGESDTGGVTPVNTLAELWNGSSWAIVPSPNASTSTSTFDVFEAVSCTGTQFCVAVGYGSSGSGNTTLTEQWNGTAWSVAASPNAPSTTDNYLNGVDCFGPTTCSAVGGSATAAGFNNLALAWNGTTWSLVGTPNQSGAARTQSYAVSCVSDWACMAVGRFGGATPYQPFAMLAPIARSGYRFVASDGGVFNYGAGSPFLGSMGGMHLNARIVGMAVMPASDGYYLVAADGGVFNFGSAQFYGSTGSLHLNAPIVGMAVTADGAGYWLVASDGGIFSYGDAQFYGSTGSVKLNKPVMGMAATPNGLGYYLVASDGGIFNYGNAVFAGSTGSLVLNKPVVGMAAPVGGGYYLVATDGGIFSFPTGSSGPPFFGSTGSIKLNKPIVGMATTAGGYYLSGSDGGIFSFPGGGLPPFFGSTGSITLNAPIVGLAG